MHAEMVESVHFRKCTVGRTVKRTRSDLESLAGTCIMVMELGESVGTVLELRGRSERSCHEILWTWTAPEFYFLDGKVLAQWV